MLKLLADENLESVGLFDRSLQVIIYTYACQFLTFAYDSEVFRN